MSGATVPASTPTSERAGGDPAKLVLVTGATGNVGREVVRALRARGIAVRAADRHRERAGEPFGADVEPCALDFLQPATFAGAARGCTAMFLLRPPAIADVKATLVPFVDEARRLGVGHVVFLSVAGAGKNRLVPHHAMEAHLAAASAPWTVLRPGFFAQNLGDAYRRDLAEEDRLYVPAGAGRVAFVDVRDVAEVAAIALESPAAHAGKAYTLTGPEAVGFEQVARLLTAALGRPIRYEPATLAGYVRHLHRRGMTATQIAVQTLLHAGLRFGQAARVDPTLAALLGRPGRSMRAYVHDHAATWRVGASTEPGGIANAPAVPPTRAAASSRPA